MSIFLRPSKLLTCLMPINLDSWLASEICDNKVTDEQLIILLVVVVIVAHLLGNDSNHLLSNHHYQASTKSGYLENYWNVVDPMGRI